MSPPPAEYEFEETESANNDEFPLNIVTIRARESYGDWDEFEEVAEMPVISQWLE